MKSSIHGSNQVLYASDMICVSVLVPTLNYGHFISDNLASIAEQIDNKRYNIQVLIQDGNSKDNTSEIVMDYAKKFPDLNISFDSGSDGSQAEALNIALKRSKGDFLMWLNADEILLPGAIAKLVSIFDRCGETVLAYGNLSHKNLRSNSLKNQYRPWFAKFHTRNGMLGVTTCCMMVSSKVFANFRFDSKLRGTLDLDFFSFLAKQPGKWKHINSLIAVNKIHPAQITYRGENNFKEELNFLTLKHGVFWGDVKVISKILYKLDCLVSMLSHKFNYAFVVDK